LNRRAVLVEVFGGKAYLVVPVYREWVEGESLEIVLVLQLAADAFRELRGEVEQPPRAVAEHDAERVVVHILRACHCKNIVCSHSRIILEVLSSSVLRALTSVPSCPSARLRARRAIHRRAATPCAADCPSRCRL